MTLTDSTGGLGFPRPDDGLPRAYGLSGSTPVEVWERFSPAYEALTERLVRALAARGFRPFFGGAGSQDGEYLYAVDEGGDCVIFLHLEDPKEAIARQRLDDTALADWLDGRITNKRRPHRA